MKIEIALKDINGIALEEGSRVCAYAQEYGEASRDESCDIPILEEDRTKPKPIKDVPCPAHGSETTLKSQPRVNEGNGGGGLVGLPKLPARLIQKRIERGWTQEELAAKTGQHVTAISHWELGTRTPNMRNAVLLCGALGCTLSWLALGEVDDIGVAMERKSPNAEVSEAADKRS